RRLTGKAALAEKFSGLQHRDHPLLALLGHDRDLNLAVLNIEHGIGSIALEEDRLSLFEFEIGSAQTNRGKKRADVEVQRRLLSGRSPYLACQNSCSHFRTTPKASTAWSVGPSFPRDSLERSSGHALRAGPDAGRTP